MTREYKEKIKNEVRIEDDFVVKTFTGRNGRKRFLGEKESLQRLRGIDGVPGVLAFDDENLSLTMERIAGTDLDACTGVPDSCFEHLHVLVEQMLDRGVARHTLRARDILCRPDGRAGLIDYEKISLRRFRFSPIWKLACAVTRLNYSRLLQERAPHLLTPAQARQLALQASVGGAHHRFLRFRRRFVEK